MITAGFVVLIQLFAGVTVKTMSDSNNTDKRILTLRLKAKWWDQIASCEKTTELRLANDYWRKRLIGQHYDEIHLWCGYPPKEQTEKRLRRRWRLVTPATILHEEFGPNPVDVFVIDVAAEVV